MVVHDSPSIKTSGAPVKLWVGGLYGTDLGSANLAGFASAVLIVSCCRTRARPRKMEFREVSHLKPDRAPAKRCTVAGAAEELCLPPSYTRNVQGGGGLIRADFRADEG